MKCKYSHCKHDSTEIKNGEEILVGKASYYHKDCYEEMSAIKKIIDSYVERVDPHPIMSLLRKVINEIVYKNKVDASFLLFAFNYCLDNGWSISHPQGLYYVAKNNAAKQQWNRIMASKSVKEMKAKLNDNEVNDDIEESKSFDYHVQKAVGFGDILK